MFGRPPRAPVDYSAMTVTPWVGRDLRAQWSPFPVGRRGALKPGVVLVAGGASHQLRAEELQQLVEHRIGIAESYGPGMLAFLIWPESVQPTSVAAASTADLPRKSLVLLVEPMDGPPAAVVTGQDLTTFSDWVRDLPV